MVIHLHHDILLLHPAEKALKVASTIEGRTQLYLHLFPGKGCKLLDREQRAFHARRRNFERIFGADRIFYVQNTADLTADDGTIVHQHAALFIDINAQHRVTTLGRKLDTPAFIAKGHDHRGQQRLQLF